MLFFNLPTILNRSPFWYQGPKNETIFVCKSQLEHNLFLFKQKYIIIFNLFIMIIFKGIINFTCGPHAFQI